MKKPLLFVLLFLSYYPTAFAKTEGQLQCALLPPIMQGYLAHHVQYKKLDDELEERTIEKFISNLDSSKAYFLKSDVDAIRAELKDIFKKVGKDCESIRRIHRIYVERLRETDEYLKKALGASDFKLQENVEIVSDPKNKKWSTSKKELQDQMLKYVQFQISSLLIADTKLDQAKKQLIHRYDLNLKRQQEFSQDDLFSLFLDSFANALDAHSGYLSGDMLEDFEISMRLSLEGIGAALVWEDGYTTVDALIPGGTAERSGEVQPKDKIVSVAQGDGAFESVIDMPLRDVVKLIRGKKGTTVRLNILRQAAKGTQHFTVALKRDKVALQDEAARLVYTNRKEGDKTLKIGIIDLPSFYGDLSSGTKSCYEDVKKLIQQAKTDKADGLVLDLSKNGGGLLQEAVRITGLFIKKGNVVATQDSKQKVEPLADEDENVVWTGPLIVLTSRLSASASEIVAGALQDYHRAVIVGGDHTFGKGTVQAMMNLPSRLGAIKVTTGMFFVPGGNSTQQRGVPADVILPSIFSNKEVGEASLDYSLPARAVTPFLTPESNTSLTDVDHWNPVEPNIIQKLRTLSSERVAKDPEFKKVKEEIAETERNKGVISLAKSVKKQKEEKEKEKGKKDSRSARSKRRQSDEEYLKQAQVAESVQVLSDLIKFTRLGTQASAR